MNNCVENIRIEDTGISFRTFSVLYRAGLHTVGDVTEMTDEQLLEIRNLGVKCLEEIKRKLFSGERLLEKTNENLFFDTDSIYDVKEFSTRIINALTWAGITTISTLKKTTDIQLSYIRNLGAKSIAEIDAVISDRIKTYEGETEELEIQCRKNKINDTGRKAIRFIESHNLTISELMDNDYRFSGNKKIRKVLTEYCEIFPERTNDVLELLESKNDTSDKLYSRLLKLRKS